MQDSFCKMFHDLIAEKDKFLINCGLLTAFTLSYTLDKRHFKTDFSILKVLLLMSYTTAVQRNAI